MIYFTADTHFGHGNIITLCQRPFDSVQEMDETLIARWNQRVGPEDTVYHLGDLTLGTAEQAQRVIARLNGTIMILGDPYHHDGRWLQWRQGMQPDIRSASDRSLIILSPIHLFHCEHPWGGKRLSVVLSHFPMFSWHKMHHGSWHLFGHSHGRTRRGLLCLDVGVDCWGYAPVSLDEIFAAMRPKQEALAAQGHHYPIKEEV